MKGAKDARGGVVGPGVLDEEEEEMIQLIKTVLGQDQSSTVCYWHTY